MRSFLAFEIPHRSSERNSLMWHFSDHVFLDLRHGLMFCPSPLSALTTLTSVCVHRLQHGPEQPAAQRPEVWSVFSFFECHKRPPRSSRPLPSPLTPCTVPPLKKVSAATKRANGTVYHACSFLSHDILEINRKVNAGRLSLQRCLHFSHQ